MTGIKHLTREIFFALPSNIQIIGNTFVQSPGVPHFQDYLTPRGPARAAQWERARAAGVEGLQCFVFDKPGDFDNFLQKCVCALWRTAWEEDPPPIRRCRRR
jgi:hypothetical protein